METRTQRSQWVQFIALVLGAFICIEAMVFQAPAIPSIAKHFQLPTYLAGLIVLSFYIASTAFYPVAGRLADQLGRRRILLFGMTVFAISEFAAAVSPSFSFFLVARVVQGLAVACILPVAISYIGVIFPPEKRGMASGLFSSVQALASCTGAVIAGYLVKLYGWPIIYWVSGVLAVIGLIVVSLFVPESKGENRRSFDLLGSLLIFICTGCLLSVSTLIKSHGITSPITLGVLAAGILAAVLIWIIENRMANPLIEISLLKIRLFALAVGINLLVVAAFQTFIYSMNFFISTKPGGNVAEVGLFYMYIYAASSIAGVTFGKLADKFNMKKLLVAILTIPIITLVMFSFIDTETSFSTIAVLACMLGFASGANTPLFMKFALSVMPPAKFSAGSGLFSLIRDFGAPLGSVTGIVVFSSFKDSFMRSSLISQAKLAGVSPGLMSAVEQAGNAGGQGIDHGLASELQSLGIKFEDLMVKATSESVTYAIQDMSYVVIGLFSVILILCFFIPNKKAETKSIGLEKDSHLVSEASI